MEEELWNIERLKEHLCSSNSVANWVVGRLSQEDRMVFWVNFELFENVPPNCFHLIPVFDDTVLNWVVQLY